MNTMNEPRARYIQDELDWHYLYTLDVAVTTPEPAWWAQNFDDLGGLAILGWAWPIPDVDGDYIMVPYCPEIIDKHTTEMDSENLDAYLTLIKYVIDWHIALFEEVLDDDERHRQVEAKLLEEMPPLHRLLRESLAMASLQGLW